MVDADQILEPHHTGKLIVVAGDQQAVDVIVPHELYRLHHCAALRDGDGAGAHDVLGPDKGGVLPQAVLADEGVDVLVGGMLEDVLRLVALDHMAVLQDADAVGQLDGLIHVVSDENNGLVEPELEPVHLVLELGAGHGVQGGEGLIHEDDLRVGGKGAGYADALPLASGELGGVLAAVLVRLQVDQLQQLGDPVVDFFLGVPGHTHGQSDVVLHRHMGEQAALLDDIAHQAGKLGHLDPVDGGAIDENLAFVNGVELVERFQQGRFPASAGTDQDKKLVVLDGQTDVHQYRFSAV